MKNVLRQYIREAVDDPGGITLTLQPEQILALADVLGMHVENVETAWPEGEEWDEGEGPDEGFELVRKLRDRLEQWISGLTESRLRLYVRETLSEEWTPPERGSTTMSRKQWRDMMRSAREEETEEHRKAYREKLKARLAKKRQGDPLDEGIFDWIQKMLAPKGQNIKAIHKAQEIVEEVYDAMAEFYEFYPRKVTKIRQRLDAALDAMDELVMSIERPRKQRH